MSQVVLGRAHMNTPPIDRDLLVDVPRLVETRLLVQANSGGGKSWALRRLLEQTHGKVQHLVIDPEGEFASLRERYDYVLAAKNGGDTVADPRAARLLAERLLELGVSAVLDIYELRAYERVAFVKGFLEALVDAPKKLWHPALVVVDEAHVYCPEKGSAESAQAVIDLATRGRKRGFCAVFATQRLSKLNKDAAAECNNKLIGRTGLDVDMDRAGEELGFSKNRRAELRELPEGHFFAFGPAISREVIAVHVGTVATTHPKAGSRLTFTAPPPTEKVRALLPKLADLPAEAEQRQKTVEDLRRQVSDLERQLRAAKTAAPAPERVEVPVLKDDHVKRLEAAVSAIETQANRGRAWIEDLQAEATGIKAALAAARNAQERAGPVRATVASAPATASAVGGGSAAALRAAGSSRPAPVVRAPSGGNGAVHPTERKILTALAQYPGGRSKVQVALLTAYNVNGGRFNNLLGALRSTGYITGTSDRLQITEQGAQALGDYQPLPTGRDLLDHWCRELPKSEAQVLMAIAERPGASKETIAQVTEYNAGGGRFNNILGRLRTLELVKRGPELRVSEDLL